MHRLILAAAVLIAPATAAFAAPVLSDGFDGEAGGTTQQDYRGFANFDVIGSVDLIRQGAFGLSCAGGAGSCVDLDGIAGGQLRTKQAFAFSAGDTVTLAFDLSGSQRGDTNPFTAGFQFDGPVTYDRFTRSGAYGSNPTGGGTGVELFQTASVASAAPFGRYQLSFRAVTGGSLRAFVSTSSTDSLGPILDSLTLDVAGSAAAVPEPATWATMLAGFGLVGGLMRRRRRVPVTLA